MTISIYPLSTKISLSEKIAATIAKHYDEEFIPVADAIDVETFLEYASSDDNCCRIDFDTGRVRIRRTPSFPHERAATSTFNQMLQALVCAGVYDPNLHCDNIGTTTLRITEYKWKQPDAGFVPTGRRYPTIIIETGYFESLADLRQDATDWLSSPLGIRLVILVYIQRNPSKTLPRRLEVEVWTWKDDAALLDQVASLHDVEAQIRIPFTDFFAEMPLVTPLTAESVFELDLQRLKNKIMESL